MTDLPGRPSRRGFLKATAAGAALASFAVPGKAQTPVEAPPLDQYKPAYFTPAEWAFVMAACDRLIPAEGNGPGAIETRVPVFIDLQLAGDFGTGATWYMQGPYAPDADPRFGYQAPYAPAEVYRRGIPAFQDWCQAQHGGRFETLDAATQDAALTALEKGEAGLAPELRELFPLLLQNTKEGYFADPIYGGNYKMAAWVHIGFPGARGSYLEWVNRWNVKYPLGPVSISGERA